MPVQILSEEDQLLKKISNLSVEQLSQLFEYFRLSKDESPSSDSSEVHIRYTSDILRERQVSFEELKEFSRTYGLAYYNHFSNAKGKSHLLRMTQDSFPEVYRILTNNVSNTELPDEWILDPCVSKEGHIRHYQKLSNTVTKWLLEDILSRTRSHWGWRKRTPKELLELVDEDEFEIDTFYRLAGAWQDNSQAKSLPMLRDRMHYLDLLSSEVEAVFENPYDFVMLIKIFEMLEDLPQLKSQLMPHLRRLTGGPEPITPKVISRLMRENGTRDNVRSLQDRYAVKSDSSSAGKPSMFRIRSEAGPRSFSIDPVVTKVPNTSSLNSLELEQHLMEMENSAHKSDPKCTECHGYQHPIDQPHIFPESLQKSKLDPRFHHDSNGRNRRKN